MENSKNNQIIIIICATILLTGIIISRTGISIKNTGGVESDGKISNSISVSGDGKVFAKPDMAHITLSFSETASSSKEALAQVNAKIAKAKEVLKSNGINDKDIETANLNIYPEYDYSGRIRRLIGQRATQSLQVKVKNIDEKATKAAKIIDELSAIDNVELGGISFDIEDKTKLFTEARKLAFDKAKQKAEELAGLSKVKLQKPISISDNTYDVSPMPFLTNTAYKTMAADSARNQATEISSGEISVSTNLSILWGIE